VKNPTRYELSRNGGVKKLNSTRERGGGGKSQNITEESLQIKPMRGGVTN